MTRIEATVVEMTADGALALVRDDGRTLHADPEAVRAGRWRMARPGQRVAVELAGPDGPVTAVLLPTAGTAI